MVNQPIGNYGPGIFWCGRIDLGPLLQGRTRIEHKIMCWESIAVVGFDLGPSIKVKRG